MVEYFCIGIILLLGADFLVSAALAAESSASVYSVSDPQEKSESVISLTKGADETVYALHISRSFLYFFLSALIVGWLISENVMIWWSVVLTAVVGAALVNLMEVITSILVRRKPYIWLARLQFVSRAALFCFKPLVIFNRGVKPVDPPDEPRQTPVTAEELKTWAAAANETGGLEPEERRMIQSIFEFGDILCREVMVPRLDVRSLDVNTTVSDAIDAFIRTGHSRIPVFEDDLDNIVGILYAKDLLQHTDEMARQKSLAGLVRPAFFVPETKKVDELLREMQERGIHIAMVVDEYGGLAGLVTLEDILEEIIGEIRDEYDPAEERPYQKLDEDYYLVQGWMPVDEFNPVFETHLDPDLAETIGGVIVAQLGKVPVGGEKLDLEHWQVQVEQVSGRRVRKLHLHRLSEEKSDTEAD
ncbi:hemolysin family protein [Leptolinea tardivitalis]|uniref:hemolysin family protein n=1 Tax=Leptolinea tardivitalis TaxID=229920 RepID=UPI000780B8D8|nr:hemolysin family protein [Leptolinea tardivitalis]GAP22223.1 hemolysins [Leptolinea tardivitalis]